jgi:hypothetical protein
MKTTMPGESTVLQELLKRFKGKLSQCKVYDANVCTTSTVPDRPWELIPVSGEPFYQQLRFTYNGRKVTVLANNIYANGETSGTFASRPFSKHDPDVRRARRLQWPCSSVESCRVSREYTAESALA